jgi:hypothetical protein
MSKFSTLQESVLKSPFPWFGGKSTVAQEVWDAFGDVRNYVEPFFGSGAVLLLRPQPFTGSESVNDKDGFLANFWRAIQADPEATANFADWPVNENDLHARHIWLVQQRETLTARLEGDPDFFDPKIAGWWVWGVCSWIGSGWCSGNGPWSIEEGQLTDARKRPHLGNAGMGVNRQLPHLGNAGMGVNRQLPHLGNAGRGVNRQLPHLGDAGRGDFILATFMELAERLRNVRVCSGDWTRVMGDSVTFQHGITGVFLDPPYADTADRQEDLYSVDSSTVAHDVRKWAIANGDNPLLRIALCGYQGEHELPEGWTCLKWKARGGYGSQGDTRGRENASKERIWFSPYCLKPSTEASHQLLFDQDDLAG